MAEPAMSVGSPQQPALALSQTPPASARLAKIVMVSFMVEGTQLSGCRDRQHFASR